MGQVCAVCDDKEDLSGGDFFQLQDQKLVLANNSRFTSYAPDTNDAVQRSLNTLQYFISIEDKDNIPESFRIKYIQQLVALRMQIFNKMRDHCDKYNGCCVNDEIIQQFGFDGAYTIFIKPQNPQEDTLIKERAEYQKLTNLAQCNEGKTLNEQMNKVASYLRILNHYDKDYLNLLVNQDDSYSLHSCASEEEQNFSQIKAYLLLQINQ